MNKNVRKLTEGAMMVALIGVALLINRQFADAFDTYLMWILPFPIIMYVIRYGARNGVLVSVCAILTSFMIALPTTIFYVAASCAIGLVYGYGIVNKKSNMWLLASVTICSMVSMIVTTFIFASIFGYNLIEEVYLMAEMFQGFESQIPNFMSTLRVLVVISYFLTCVMEGVLIHLLAYIFLRRMKVDFPQFKMPTEVRAPKWLGIVTCVAFISNAVGPNFTQNTQILEILIAINIVGLFFAMIFGYLAVLAIAAQYGKRKMVGQVITRLLLLSLLLYFLYANQMVPFNAAIYVWFYFMYGLVLIGVVDMVFDLRRYFARR